MNHTNINSLVQESIKIWAFYEEWVGDMRLLVSLIGSRMLWVRREGLSMNVATREKGSSVPLNYNTNQLPAPLLQCLGLFKTPQMTDNAIILNGNGFYARGFTWRHKLVL
jgi:hypothetical protein